MPTGGWVGMAHTEMYASQGMGFCSLPLLCIGARAWMGHGAWARAPANDLTCITRAQTPALTTLTASQALVPANTALINHT